MRRQLTADELDALFQSIGRCIWHIQYLEDVLHTHLTLKIELREPGRVTEEEAREMLAKHRRATLGIALKTAKKHNALDPKLLNDLENLKDDRNWLVHRSMDQDGDSLYTDEGRYAVFTRLESLMDTTLNLKKRLLAETEAFCSSHGVSPQQAGKIGQQIIARLKGDV